MPAQYFFIFRVRDSVMYKKTILIIAAMALAFGVSAQRDTKIAKDTSLWDFHLSTGTSFVGGGGKSNAYFWTAPSVEYRVTKRLTLRGGFAYAGSLLDGYELHYTPSFAPRRSGTRLVGAKVMADYWASDRMNIWFSLARMGGWHEPIWTPKGEAFPVDVTVLSGGFNYALSDDSMLEMHFHFVHDHYGNDALGILGHPYYGYGVPSYELYGGPWFF